MLISTKKKPLIALLILCFLTNTFGAAAFGGAINMPAASFYQPPLLKYLSINSANPYNYFNFLLDKGQGVPYSKLGAEADKTINYFFLGLTLKEDSFWVNLKPQEPDRMTSKELAKTDMGKVLLNQDLLLKKDTAKYLHPDNFRGKEFWQRLYSAVGKINAKKMAFDSYNRVWIVPDKATAVKTEDGVLITEARLKVLLESEYLKNQTVENKNTADGQNIDKITQSLMKEIIIPELTFDVNNSPRYAPLRQVYHSLILAQYYKNKYNRANSLYSGIINKNQTKGLESQYPWSKQKIWQDYLKSYEQGEYKVKHSLAGLNRMYFSGGIVLNASSGINSLNGILTVYSAGSALSNVEFNSSSPLPNMPMFWGTSSVSASSVGEAIKPQESISFEDKQGEALIIDFIESTLKQASMTLNEIMDALFLSKDEQWRKQADITPEGASQKVETILAKLIEQGKIIKEFPGRSLKAKKAEHIREKLEAVEIEITNIKNEIGSKAKKEIIGRTSNKKIKSKLKREEQKRQAILALVNELDPQEWERQKIILELHKQDNKLALIALQQQLSPEMTIENIQKQQAKVRERLEELEAPVYTAASSSVTTKKANPISPREKERELKKRIDNMLFLTQYYSTLLDNKKASTPEAKAKEWQKNLDNLEAEKTNVYEQLEMLQKRVVFLGNNYNDSSWTTIKLRKTFKHVSTTPDKDTDLVIIRPYMIKEKSTIDDIKKTSPNAKVIVLAYKGDNYQTVKNMGVHGLVVTNDTSIRNRIARVITSAFKNKALPGDKLYNFGLKDKTLSPRYTPASSSITAEKAKDIVYLAHSTASNELGQSDEYDKAALSLQRLYQLIEKGFLDEPITLNELIKFAEDKTAEKLLREAMEISLTDTTSKSSSSLIALSASGVLEAINSLISEKKEEVKLLEGNGQSRELRKIIKELSELPKAIEDSDQEEWDIWDIVDLAKNETVKELLEKQMELTAIYEARPETPNFEAQELSMWDTDVSDWNTSSSIKSLPIEKVQQEIRSARSQLVEQLNLAIENHSKLETVSEHLSQAINVLDELSPWLREIKGKYIIYEGLIEKLNELIEETNNETDVSEILRKELNFSSNNTDIHTHIPSPTQASSSIAFELKPYLNTFQGLKKINNIPNLTFFPKMDNKTSLEIDLPAEALLKIELNRETGEVVFKTQTTEFPLEDVNLADAFEIGVDTESREIFIILTDDIAQKVYKKPIPTMAGFGSYVYSIVAEVPSYATADFKFKLKDYLEGIKQMEKISKLPCTHFYLDQQEFDLILELSDGGLTFHNFRIDLDDGNISYSSRREMEYGTLIEGFFEDKNLLSVFEMEADEKKGSLALTVTPDIFQKMQQPIETDIQRSRWKDEKRNFYIPLQEKSLQDPHGKGSLKSWEIKKAFSRTREIPQTRKVGNDILLRNTANGILQNVLLTDNNTAALSEPLKFLKKGLASEYFEENKKGSIPAIKYWSHENTVIHYENMFLNKKKSLTDGSILFFNIHGKGSFKIEPTELELKVERISEEEFKEISAASSSINASKQGEDTARKTLQTRKVSNSSDEIKADNILKSILKIPSTVELPNGLRSLKDDLKPQFDADIPPTVMGWFYKNAKISYKERMRLTDNNRILFIDIKGEDVFKISTINESPYCKAERISRETSPFASSSINKETKTPKDTSKEIRELTRKIDRITKKIKQAQRRLKGLNTWLQGAISSSAAGEVTKGLRAIKDLETEREQYVSELNRLKQKASSSIKLEQILPSALSDGPVTVAEIMEEFSKQDGSKGFSKEKIQKQLDLMVKEGTVLKIEPEETPEAETRRKIENLDTAIKNTRLDARSAARAGIDGADDYKKANDELKRLKEERETILATANKTGSKEWQIQKKIMLLNATYIQLDWQIISIRSSRIDGEEDAADLGDKIKEYESGQEQILKRLQKLQAPRYALKEKPVLSSSINISNTNVAYICGNSNYQSNRVRELGRKCKNATKKPESNTDIIFIHPNMLSTHIPAHLNIASPRAQIVVVSSMDDTYNGSELACITITGMNTDLEDIIEDALEGKSGSNYELYNWDKFSSSSIKNIVYMSNRDNDDTGRRLGAESWPNLSTNLILIDQYALLEHPLERLKILAPRATVIVVRKVYEGAYRGNLPCITLTGDVGLEKILPDALTGREMPNRYRLSNWRGASSSIKQQSKDEILEGIKRIFSETFHIVKERITTEAELIYLGIDSLDLMEAAIAIEKEFKIDSENIEYTGSDTIGNIVDFIYEQVNASSSISSAQDSTNRTASSAIKLSNMRVAYITKDINDNNRSRLKKGCKEVTDKPKASTDLILIHHKALSLDYGKDLRETFPDVPIIVINESAYGCRTELPLIKLATNNNIDAATIEEAVSRGRSRPGLYRLENWDKLSFGQGASSSVKRNKKTEIFEKVKEEIVAQMRINQDSFTLESDLVEVLGADSLELYDLALTLSIKFKIDTDDIIDAGPGTVDDLVSFIDKEVSTLSSTSKKSSAKQTKDEIFKKVTEVFVEEFALDEDTITPNATLKGDLGLDSLELLTLSAYLDKKFKTNNIDVQYGVITVKDVIDAVAENLAPSSSIQNLGQKTSSSIGGIDLNKIKVNIEQARNLAPQDKDKAVAKLKTLYAVDALMNKEWDGLAYLYLQEILLLAKNNLIKDFDEEDKAKLAWVGNTLKEKGYINGSDTLKLIAGLKTTKSLAKASLRQ